MRVSFWMLPSRLSHLSDTRAGARGKAPRWSSRATTPGDQARRARRSWAPA